MITRREVIASGLAVSALAHTPAASFAGLSPAAGIRPVRQFIADGRFAEAHAAARAAQTNGAAIRSLAEDVTALYESLDLAWRSALFATAGLTTNNAFFVIERLGWERGLRTVYRGLHRQGADGRFQHELLGSPALKARLELDTAIDWAARLGSALTGATPPLAEPRHFPPQSVPGIDGVTLVSWQLVPKDQIGRRA